MSLNDIIARIFVVLEAIDKYVQKMPYQELLAYHHVIIEATERIRKLNPPQLNDTRRGELSDELDQLLKDLFVINTMVQNRLKAFLH